MDSIRPEEWDAAKRASDAVGLHLIGKGKDAIGRYLAIRLSDGGSDNVLYDTRGDAMRHQLHENYCAYLRIPPTGTTPKKAFVFLAYMRQFYDNGGRFTDESPRLPMMSEELAYLSPRLGRLTRPGI